MVIGIEKKDKSSLQPLVVVKDDLLIHNEGYVIGRHLIEIFAVYVMLALYDR
jgi:hypothetical protein